MSKSFLVLGLGRFGMTVAQALCELGHEVMGIDDEERLVKHAAPFLTEAVEADVTDESFLRTLDVATFDATIVAVGENIQVSIMSTLLLKEMGARYILVKAQDDFQERVLIKLGADKVVLPERDTGNKVAQQLSAGNWMEMIDLSEAHGIIKFTTPGSWIGKTLGELAVRAKYRVNIIAVTDPVLGVVIPDADTRLTEGSEMTALGEKHDLKRLGRVQ
jgi:trk system potassium uptake protein